MNKKQIIVALIGLVFSFQFASAQESEHPIDKKFDECSETNWSTAGMIECEQIARQEWDAEMNKYYKLLMGILNEEGREQLKQSQLAWLKYRDLEMEFRGHSIGVLPGTLHLAVASGAVTDVAARQRAMDLKTNYDIIQHASE